jgi:hypothetical protein
VRFKRGVFKDPSCPTFKGHEGEWVGSPLGAADWYCSYEWKGGGYSEFGWLDNDADHSPLHRSTYESIHYPTDFMRADVRPDCMEVASPCINRDGSFDCITIEAPKPVNISEAKGMSPCGACAEAISERELLVVLPHWFSALGTREAPRELRIKLSDTGMGYIVPQPEGGEQTFIIKAPGGLMRGVQYTITR